LTRLAYGRVRSVAEAVRSRRHFAVAAEGVPGAVRGERLGGSEPLAWTLQWMMSGTVVVALVMAWRSRLSYSLKAAALAAATLLVTPYLFLYDEMVLAIPVAWLVRTGLAEGFTEYELPALGCVALLLLSFPWVGAPVGLGATLIVAMLIVARWRWVQSAANRSPVENGVLRELTGQIRQFRPFFTIRWMI
jgi:hypothetical protein